MVNQAPESRLTYVPGGAPAEAAECATCGAALAGPFCATCGQRALEGRHTLRGLARGVVARVFDLDRGLVHTVARLTVDPGGVVGDYVRGRTVPYVHPVAYLVVALAAFAVTIGWLGGTGGGDDRVFWGGMVVFLAGASRGVFRGAGLNYAEHLIISLYLFAHAALLLTAAIVLAWLAPDGAGAALTGAGLAAAAGYLVWGYSRTFPATAGARLGRLRSVLGALLVLAVGFLAWAAVLVVLVRAVRG